MALVTKEDLNNMYLFYLLVKFELSNIADTSSVPQINNKHIEPIKIPFPLSTTDEKLENLKAKKESLEELKKGLMQKLLTKELELYKAALPAFFMNEIETDKIILTLSVYSLLKLCLLLQLLL